MTAPQPSLEPVAYSHAGVELTGWLARPEGTPRAAVALFPTIANVIPLMEERARRLAAEGYLVMITDFYGEPIESFEASFPFAEKLRADNAYYRARIIAGIEALRGIADGLKVFAIGHCMGGQAVLEAARAGEDLAGVVSFHGTLPTTAPAQPGGIKPRILVCHGDADPLVPREHVVAFWEEMDAAGANWHFHSYGNVKHGFTDPHSPDKGMAFLDYNVSADRQSWASMLAFFDEILS
ncbi:dienelactone hydrolase family protein [Novosphingobium guangzhouense]|uniref:Dienelactone hydrolase n=1 Tax=Novosphingobium guangzhouense TaxID=1850347 RepID=A0A2K2G1M7_9SPHN|nr:dienelactone hydrolase family protein [Novosphingobium guangzhouense]PNU04888.1 dienelactone hydrolase [Novosphingobium guangzhouense]